MPTFDSTLNEQLRRLSLDPATLAGWTPYPEPSELVLVGADYFHRDAYLAPAAADAWVRMCDAAASTQLNLLLISAYRSHARQAALFQRKLDQGWLPNDILCILAPPGFSEHHTGRAVDIGAPGHTDLTESFEETPEFKWLERHAASFSFHLSYPRDNPRGTQYEPWHWLYRGS